MALIQQERRVSVLKELREELIDYKNEFESYSNYESFDESFRALDPECQNIRLISSYDLYISTVLPLEHKGLRLVKCVKYYYVSCAGPTSLCEELSHHYM